MHYQECCAGIKKKFGSKYIIVGDQEEVKNGFKYEVWGMSEDPSTWKEQNCTLKGAKVR